MNMAFFTLAVSGLVVALVSMVTNRDGLMIASTASCLFWTGLTLVTL